jgi:acyl-CoA synthetase (NDP forming)
MTDLARFLNPRSIAIIGAAPDPTKIRGAIQHMVISNNYSGSVYPVNPSHRVINGVPCHAKITEIDAVIDLAVVVLPARLVPESLESCAAAGVPNAIIISSGFAEEGNTGLQDRIAGIAARTGMRICGPNAEGFYNALDGVAVTFSPTVAPASGPQLPVMAGKPIGVVAQSGGMGFALYHRGRALALPFSHIISTGNEVDLTAADFFAHLVDDERTGVILLVLESIRDPTRFRAAAACAQAIGKPVIAVKMGRSEAGIRATASHTASMAGWHTAYRTAFRHYGILEATDPDEAVAMAAALATAPRAAGTRVAVVTLSGGAGAWAADALAAAGLQLPELPADLQADIATLLPSYGTARNPVDVTAQAVRDGGLYQSIEKLLAADAVDQVFAVLSLASETRTSLSADELRALAAYRKPLLNYTYALPSRLAIETFAGAGAVVFAGLREAAAAAAALAAPTRPPQPIAQSGAPLLPAISAALSEAESRELLAANGIALPPARLVTRAEDLAAAAAELGYPLAMKAQSRALPHKTEAGGVVLGLRDAAGVRDAWQRIHAAVAAHAPDVVLQGVLLCPMAEDGVEMIIGGLFDPVFGAMLSVGAGGTATELYQDVAWRLAPLDGDAALAMLRELRCFRLLDGFRGAPRGDLAALAELLVRVAALLHGAGGRIAEIELNPVRVHPRGASVLDALAVLR